MKSRTKKIIGWSAVALIVVALVAGIILTDGMYTSSEDISDVMQDAVLHEENQVSIFGYNVNPGLVSAFVVTIILLAAATLFELIGAAVVSTAGNSVALPAPLSDINGAIAMGFLSYFVILSGGIVSNGMRGVGRTLKDFSLPISMSFRLFGALLSGLLVTELVYYYIALSFVLPVIVGVLFTLLHALIQTYVLVMLTSLFYGEVSEPHVKVPKEKKKKAKAVKVKQ